MAPQIETPEKELQLDRSKNDEELSQNSHEELIEFKKLPNSSPNDNLRLNAQVSRDSS